MVWCRDAVVWCRDASILDNTMLSRGFNNQPTTTAAAACLCCFLFFSWYVVLFWILFWLSASLGTSFHTAYLHDPLFNMLVQQDSAGTPEPVGFCDFSRQATYARKYVGFLVQKRVIEKLTFP